MDLERFCLKFFVRETDIDETTFIPIFHDWIRQKTLPGTLLDVADYRHVPDGPGIMLIAYETNYAMEHIDGQFGLSGQHKLGEGNTNKERILDLAKRMASFGDLLESDERVAGKIKFEGNKFLYRANDRLKAPNTDETYAALKPDLADAAESLYPGKSVSITRVDNDPRSRLEILVEVADAVDISSLV